MEESLGKPLMQALHHRLGGRPIVCGLCGGTRWGSDGIVNIPVSDTLSSIITIGGTYLPLMPMTCEVCGNTVLFNVVRLLGRERLEQMRKEVKADEILTEVHSARVNKEGGQITDEGNQARTS